MILLDSLRQGERELPRLLVGDCQPCLLGNLDRFSYAP